MISSSTSFERSLDLTQLIKIKFSLNKLGRIDNIEKYSINVISELYKAYESYIDGNDGQDVEFPGFFFGKDAKIKAEHRKRDKKLKSRKKK